MAEVRKWTSDDGNRCFYFKEREALEHPWIIFSITFLLIIITGSEYLINSSYHSLLPNLIIFIFVFWWWMERPLKWNENVIEKTLHDIMDDVTYNDADAVGTKVVKSLVHYDTKGTYGIITGRYFLVLLKNGDVFEYPISYHHPTESSDGFYECDRQYSISENQEHIQAINPKRWSSLRKSLKLSDNIVLWLLIFTIVFVGGLSYFSFFWLIFKIKWWTLILAGGYFAVYYSLRWMYKKWSNNTIRAICKIVSIPNDIFYILLVIAIPFSTIFGTCLYIFLYAFCVPALLLIGLSNLGWFTFKTETIAFIVIALGSILCSHSYKLTKWLIHQTPLRNWGNHTYESYRESLAVYLIHPSNVIFLLYLVYFVFLGISGFLQIEKNSYLFSDVIDAAILKAFLVFIAFTNMRAKSEVMKVEAKELLQRTLKLFVHDKYE